MKKTTLLFVLFSIIFPQLNAQLSEDFEGSFPPTDWTISDNGIGTSIGWESTAGSFTGDKAAFIDYDLSGDTEDWLISPAFTQDTNNNILTFYQKQDLVSDEGSTYTIRVKNITDNVDFVIIDTQNEASFSDVYVLHSVQLPIEYNGKNIQIAFVLAQNDGDSWYLDKVSTKNPTGEVPDCAINHSPTNTATDVVNLASEVFLSWDAPTSEVSSYEVWIGEGVNPLSLITEVGDTNYTFTGALYATTYNWKVVPKNYAVGATSCVARSFTTQIENTNLPVNDSCSTAISISGSPYENTQDATNATNNYPLDGGFVKACGTGPFIGMNDGVWYTFTTNIGGAVNIDITNVSGAFNVEVAVYSGTCGNLICTGFKDTAATGAGASESLSVVVEGTTQYWINVGSNSESIDETEGAFKIALSSDGGVVLGVDKIEDNLDVSLYPNPTSDIINIKYDNTIDAIRIYNLLGQEVEAVILNKRRTQLDLSNYTSGMYVVVVYSGEKKGSYRVIKQ